MIYVRGWETSLIKGQSRSLRLCRLYSLSHLLMSRVPAWKSLGQHLNKWLSYIPTKLFAKPMAGQVWSMDWSLPPCVYAIVSGSNLPTETNFLIKLFLIIQWKVFKNVFTIRRKIRLLILRYRWKMHVSQSPRRRPIVTNKIKFRPIYSVETSPIALVVLQCSVYISIQTRSLYEIPIV